MKLYPIPGGTWAGTEADWKKALKARGLDHKDFPAKTREVPTGKAELLEFLNFYAVDVFRTGDGKAPSTTPTAGVDVEALRREHNPQPEDMALEAAAPPPPAPDYAVPGTLADQFAVAPIKLQAEIVVAFIDRLTA